MTVDGKDNTMSSSHTVIARGNHPSNILPPQNAAWGK